LPTYNTCVSISYLHWFEHTMNYISVVNLFILKHICRILDKFRIDATEISKLRKIGWFLLVWFLETHERISHFILTCKQNLTCYLTHRNWTHDDLRYILDVWNSCKTVKMKCPFVTTKNDHFGQNKCPYLCQISSDFHNFSFVLLIKTFFCRHCIIHIQTCDIFNWRSL
jgi:hypothetical protein